MSDRSRSHVRSRVLTPGAVAGVDGHRQAQAWIVAASGSCQRDAAQAPASTQDRCGGPGAIIAPPARAIHDAIRRARPFPTLAGRLLHAFGPGLDPRREHPAWWWKTLASYLESGAADWCRWPELAALGHALLDRSVHPSLRRWACVWLTEFPTLETTQRLAEILGDPTEDVVVQNQAAWTLGYRQLQQRHDALWWGPEALSAADRALSAAWARGEEEAGAPRSSERSSARSRGLTPIPGSG